MLLVHCQFDNGNMLILLSKGFTLLMLEFCHRPDCCTVKSARSCPRWYTIPTMLFTLPVIPYSLFSNTVWSCLAMLFSLCSYSMSSLHSFVCGAFGEALHSWILKATPFHWPTQFKESFLLDTWAKSNIAADERTSFRWWRHAHRTQRSSSNFALVCHKIGLTIHPNKTMIIAQDVLAAPDVPRANTMLEVVHKFCYQNIRYCWS